MARGRRSLAAAVTFAAVGLASPLRAEEVPPPTYAIRYRVHVSERTPLIARVRWEMAGIDEIRSIRLGLRGRDFYDFSGTGRLEERSGEIVWRPNAPYAHLQYKVRLRHRHREGQGYDSWAADDWILTRAQALFPATHVTFAVDVERKPRSRAEVIFELPQGWRSHTAMAPLGDDRFRPTARGRRLDRPSGWIALGHLAATERAIGGSAVAVVRPEGSSFDAAGVLALYEKTLPLLATLLGRKPARLLVVSGPDPMWHGGLSGEDSLYLHERRPVRTPDRTSPPLHELFHVLTPFHPGADARWIAEGLAEYYSLELQRRAGLLDEAEFTRGLELFGRYGKWQTDLTSAHDAAVTNNSAPLVLHALDGAVRRATRDAQSLDDVVRTLAQAGGRLTTSGLLRAVNGVTRHNFTSFFRRHVYRGEPVELRRSSRS